MPYDAAYRREFGESESSACNYMALECSVCVLFGSSAPADLIGAICRALRGVVLKIDNGPSFFFWGVYDSC